MNIASISAPSSGLQVISKAETQITTTFPLATGQAKPRRKHRPARNKTTCSRGGKDVILYFGRYSSARLVIGNAATSNEL